MRESRMAGDVKAGRLYSDGACSDPIDADLAEAESEIAAAAGELRAAGWSLPALYTSAGEPSADPSTAEDLLSAAGCAVGAVCDFASVNQMMLSFGWAVSKEMDGAASAAVIEKGISHLNKVGMAGKAYAFVSGTASAYGSLRQYYEEHPELPQLVKESNAAAEFDIHKVAVLIEAYAPFFSGQAKSAYFDFVYTPNDDGVSIADKIYEVRYELFGRYGL